MPSVTSIILSGRWCLISKSLSLVEWWVNYFGADIHLYQKTFWRKQLIVFAESKEKFVDTPFDSQFLFTRKHFGENNQQLIVFAETRTESKENLSQDTYFGTTIRLYQKILNQWIKFGMVGSSNVYDMIPTMSHDERWRGRVSIKPTKEKLSNISMAKKSPWSTGLTSMD